MLLVSSVVMNGNEDTIPCYQTGATFLSTLPTNKLVKEIRAFAEGVTESSRCRRIRHCQNCRGREMTLPFSLDKKCPREKS